MIKFQDIADKAVAHHGAMQKPSELAALLGWLAPLGLEGVLEIGGMHGGTMWCWAQVCTGPYACVDLQVLEGRMDTVAGLDHRLIVADSTDRATVQQVCDQKFDFIFIDGSHRYADVTKDFENWLPLLSDSGVIAFHDICHRRMRDHDMWRFWQDVLATTTQHAYEIYDPAQQWGGIGVLSARRLRVLPNEYTDRAGLLRKPPQCEDPICECCCAVLALESGEETLCRECAAR